MWQKYASSKLVSSIIIFIFVLSFFPVSLSAAVGDVTLNIETDGGGLTGLNVYAFSDTGSYTGLNSITTETGQALFDSSDFSVGNYKFRVDYLGYQFWSEINPVEPGSLLSVSIPHHNSTITAQGLYQENTDPIAGIKVYLFSAAGSYLGQSQTTDANGQVTFNLPNKEYKVRADYVGGLFWSEIFQFTDAVVDVPMADAEITVTGAGTPLEGVKVYAFRESGSYLDLYQTSDANGKVSFHLPAKAYKFRADYLGSQYWSEVESITTGQINSIAISTGGGLFSFTVLQGESVPLSGVKCYVFSESGSYLGLNEMTDQDGSVSFSLADGNYKFRVDYSGNQFWSAVYAVPETLSDDFSIPHHNSTITVQGLYQENTDPIAGIKVYLFSAASSYLGQNQTTDANGQITFNLPDKEYKVRADYMGGQFWSEIFQFTDAVVDIPMAYAEITITGAGTPLEGVKVYAFRESGSYLDLYQTSDANGKVSFHLPAKAYKFRADVEGKQHWSQTIVVTANIPTPIDIEISPLIVSLSSSPTNIELGENAILTWNSTGAETCTIEPNIGNVDLNNDAPGLSVTPTETATYTITATGPGGMATASVTVTVISGQPTPTAAIFASPEIIELGGEGDTESVLTWATTNATSVSIDQGIGKVALNSDEGEMVNSITVTPTETTTHTLTATGPGGTATASVTVTVIGGQPTPTAAIFASPEIIELGGEGDTESVLTWATSNATSVSIDQGIGEVALNSDEGEMVNSITVTPTETTTYTLTATGPGGTATASVTITVIATPPSAEISSSQVAVVSGESVDITWKTENAETITINQGVGSVLEDGSITVNPTETKTYTITATGPGGTAIEAVTVRCLDPSSFEIAIISPNDGQTLLTTQALVKGIVVSGMKEVGVTINGQLAQVNGTSFFFNDLSLAEGENSITATATKTDGTTTSDTISTTIDSSTITDWIELSMNPESGVAPLSTNLTADLNLSFTPHTTSLEYDGPGEVRVTQTPNNKYDLLFETPGIYTLIYVVTGDLGKQSEQKIMVNVINKTALDVLLKSKWEGLTNILATKDIEGSLEYFTESSQERYRSVMTAISDQLPQIATEMTENIGMVYSENSTAKYRINRTHAIDSTPTTITYYIYFTLNNTGLWKIEQF